MEFYPAATKLPLSRSKLIREYQALGLTKKEAIKIIRDLRQDEVWANDEFTVTVTKDYPNGFELNVTELSIKRNDKEPIMDWRKLQQIKNALVGKECDAIQIFPAESRLVDTANQYWLFVFTDPTVRVPLGFTERHVSNTADITGSKQRPFD